MKQRGSVHTILIGGLVIALIGALGFIYWQNFLQGKDVNSSTNTTQTVDVSRDTTTQKIAEWIQMDTDIDLQAYMAPTVNYAVADSSAGLSDAPKSQVYTTMGDYLAGSVNEWTSHEFDTLTGHEGFVEQANADAQFIFAGSYVCLNTYTTSEDFAAFKIDDQGLITDVYVGTYYSE